MLSEKQSFIGACVVLGVLAVGGISTAISLNADADVAYPDEPAPTLAEKARVQKQSSSIFTRVERNSDGTISMSNMPSKIPLEELQSKAAAQRARIEARRAEQAAKIASSKPLQLGDYWTTLNAIKNNHAINRLQQASQAKTLQTSWIGKKINERIVFDNVSENLQGARFKVRNYQYRDVYCELTPTLKKQIINKKPMTSVRLTGVINKPTDRVIFMDRCQVK